METPTTDPRRNKSELDCKRHGVGEVATAVQKQRSGKGKTHQAEPSNQPGARRNDTGLQSTAQLGVN